MKSEPESRKIRWGVLGCARVAEAVAIPGIQRSGNGTVLAVASRDLAKAEDWARQFAIERSYANYEALIADPDVEAVYIPLINSLHREWTIRAAERGKHVLCEKPLACSVREAQEMVEACSRYGVILMETFAHRFQPQNLQVKKLINDGKIGKVVGMTAVHSSGRPPSGDIRLDKDLGGGVLGDKGCYCVNTARFIMESEPDSVYASIVFGDQSGVDERVRAVIHFPGNATVFFRFGVLSGFGKLLSRLRAVRGRWAYRCAHGFYPTGYLPS